MRRRVHPTTLARREREREAEARREREREESRAFFASFDRVEVTAADDAHRAWAMPTLRTFTTAILADGTHVSEIVRGIDGEWFVQSPHFPGWRFFRLVPRDEHDAHVRAHHLATFARDWEAGLDATLGKAGA